MSTDSRSHLVTTIDQAMAVDTTAGGLAGYRDAGEAIVKGCKAIDDYFYSTPAPDKALWREVFLRVMSEGPWAGSNSNPLASKMIEVAGQLRWADEFALARLVLSSPDTARGAESLRNIYNPSKKSGCYIATAVYGSYDAEPVLVFRRFRDERLAGHAFGRAFIRSYYAVSPPLARYFAGRTALNRLARRLLDRLAKLLDDAGSH
ncbi:UNVERIFIED_ORG: hypothetical protein J2X79_001982 [Arthrobacter globiformis]|nr:hypothetical protein [Arthrobacter globiformis]